MVNGFPALIYPRAGYKYLYIIRIVLMQYDFNNLQWDLTTKYESCCPHRDMVTSATHW